MRWAQAIPLGALAVFFAFPVVTMLASFARPSDITSTLTNASLVRLWWFTAWQAALSTVLTVAVALPITWAVSRYSFRFSKTLIGLITVPFFMPAVVIATGVKAVLPSAPVPAILWAHVVFNVAVIVRIVGPRWAMLDTTLEDTAADLGATSLRTFRFIVLPHIAPALKNAAAVVFLFCFSSFGVIAILGGIKRRTIEAEIFTQAVNLGDTRTAVSLSVIQAVVILIVFTLGTRQSRVTNTSRTTDTTNDIATTLRIPTQRQRRRIVAAVALPVLIVVAPLVAVILRSLRLDGHFTLDGYRWLFNGTTEAVGINIASTLLTSTTFAITCAVLTTTAALMIASAKNNTSLISARRHTWTWPHRHIRSGTIRMASRTMVDSSDSLCHCVTTCCAHIRSCCARHSRITHSGFSITWCWSVENMATHRASTSYASTRAFRRSFCCNLFRRIWRHVIPDAQQLHHCSHCN